MVVVIKWLNIWVFRSFSSKLYTRSNEADVRIMPVIRNDRVILLAIFIIFPLPSIYKTTLIEYIEQNPYQLIFK